MNKSTIYQVPSGEGVSVVDLADGSRRYRKQLVKFGKYVHPNLSDGQMVLDRKWAESIMKNFRDKVIPKIPVVEGHPKTSAELLAATRGELSGLSLEDDGLYGELEIRDPATAEKIDNELIFDDSVSYHENYRDKASGAFVGPAFRHIGLVNDPYVKGMQPFQALSDDDANVIMLSEMKESKVSKIKNEHDYPVTVTYTEDGAEKKETIQPGAEVEVPEAVAETVKTQVSEATKPETDEEKTAREEAEAKAAADAKKEADEKAARDKAAAEGDKDAQLKQANEELAKAKADLSERDAKDAYTVALSEGKVVPAQEGSFKKLYSAASNTTVELSDGGTEPLSDVLAEFLKVMPKRVDLSEQGTSGDDEKTPWQKLSPEQQEANRKMDISEAEYNKVNGPESDDKDKE